HHRDGVWKLLENFGEDQPARRRDLAVLAVEGGFPLWMAGGGAPRTTRPKIDLADRHRIPFSEASPPPLDVFGLGHRLKHKVPRRIEQPRHADFLFRGCGDFKTAAICHASYDHDSSPSSF